MGSITGERRSSQARAIREGLAPSSLARVSSGPPGPASWPVAIGNHGMKPRFSHSAYSRTSSAPRLARLYRFRTETMSAIFRASSICSTVTSDRSMCRILPSRYSRSSSPTWSASGTLGSIRRSW